MIINDGYMDIDGFIIMDVFWKFFFYVHSKKHKEREGRQERRERKDPKSKPLQSMHV